MLKAIFSRLQPTKCALRMSSTSSAGKLAGKVAIVTASTEGIGLAIARRLGQDGAKVMVSSRKQANVDKTVQELKSENLAVEGMVCHVGKAEDRTSLIKETVSKFGGIDILVSNAASNPVFGQILDTDEGAWDKLFLQPTIRFHHLRCMDTLAGGDKSCLKEIISHFKGYSLKGKSLFFMGRSNIMDTNVKASFFLCKEVVPHMEPRGGGSVIFISSFAGYLPMEFLGPYSISKTALFGLTKALVPQLTRVNIRVNAVAPGMIKTRFSEQLWKSDAAHEILMQMIPMKRIGKPSEISGLVSFLSSEDASYITGEIIFATGGIPGRL